MTTCTNCNYEVALNYCPNCGQPAKVKRIDAHYITHEIEHVLHFERGILYTIRELLIRPGDNVRNFIAGHRSRLVKPIIFIIITSLIYSIITHLFHIESGYVQYRGDKENGISHIFEWVEGHYGYSNIIMGVFIALWAKLFFRKYNYNFFEILILLCFVMGIGMLFFAFFTLLQGITHIELTSVAGIIFIFYCSWAMGHFFDKKKTGNYFKALGAYILGMLTFAIVAILLGVGIDAVIKH
ncbi:DUF3667 domain-containing protein [Mucilaginibacter auburnensis]|nr:DUF3667 domain-containing protein [Mucilaginibacter auburnensis]